MSLRASSKVVKKAVPAVAAVLALAVVAAILVWTWPGSPPSDALPAATPTAEVEVRQPDTQPPPASPPAPDVVAAPGDATAGGDVAGPPPVRAGPFVLSFGVFISPDQAQRLAGALASRGIAAAPEPMADASGRTRLQVLGAGFATRAEARAAGAAIAASFGEAHAPIAVIEVDP